MKRLSMLAALSMVLVAGFVGNSAQAQGLSGSVLLQDMGPRQYPLGYDETGRFARFIMDDRMSDLNLKNRDFEAWKPLDVQSKQKIRHHIFGKLNTEQTPVADQEIGRYIRVLQDDRFLNNNMEFNDRTFYPYQAPSPYTAQADSAMTKSYIRGLPAGTNLGPVINTRYQRVPIGAVPHVLYF